MREDSAKCPYCNYPLACSTEYQCSECGKVSSTLFRKQRVSIAFALVTLVSMLVPCIASIRNLVRVADMIIDKYEADRLCISTFASVRGVPIEPEGQTDVTTLVKSVQYILMLKHRIICGSLMSLLLAALIAAFLFSWLQRPQADGAGRIRIVIYVMLLNFMYIFCLL